MNTPTLAEKLKELLMGCDITIAQSIGIYNSDFLGYYPSSRFAEVIAQQLAPEIEKLIPQWIPVGERLPDEGQLVDIWHLSQRYENMGLIHGRSGNYFTNIDGNVTIWVENKSDIHWTPIMKGPMG